MQKLHNGKAAIKAVIDKLHASDIVCHGGGGEETRGLKDLKQDLVEWFNAFLDLHFTVSDMVVEGDKVYPLRYLQHPFETYL